MFESDHFDDTTSEVTIRRGLEVYYENKVLRLVIEESIAEDIVSAQVQGSGRILYETELYIDLINGQVNDSWCNCPAFRSFSGLCKHCVAVLIAYKLRILDLDTSALSPGDILYLLRSNTPEEPPAPETTFELKNLLAMRTGARLLPILEDDVFGKVKLEPHLEYNYYNGFSLSFKIGTSQMYVLKDITEFIGHLQNHTEYKYGKQLKFTHTRDSFSMDSLPMLSFLNNYYMKMQEKIDRSSSQYLAGYYYTPRIKQIPLTLRELDEFILTIEDQSLHVTMNHYPLPGDSKRFRKGVYQVTNEPFRPSLELKGCDDGIVLTADTYDTFLTSHSMLYFGASIIHRLDRSCYKHIQDLIFCIYESNEGRVFVANEDISAFCREFLEPLEEIFKVTRIGFNPEDHLDLSHVVTFEVYLDLPQRNLISCELFAKYDERKYSLFTSSQPENALSRDLIKETVVEKTIHKYFNTYNDEECKLYVANDEEMLYDLLVDGIPAMQEMAIVFVSDALKSIHTRKSPKLEVGVSLSGEMLELYITSKEMSKEELMDILSKYNPRKKYYRLKTGEFVTVEDDSFDALLELQESLHITDKQLSGEVVSLPRYRAMYLDSAFKEWSSLSVKKDHSFKSLIRNMKTIDESDYEVPSSLMGILREYQKKGFLWLKTLNASGLGGILADDMGLGKTLQVISFLLSELQEAGPEDNRKSLIISPASLVYNWKNEFQQFAPELSVKIVAGNADERENILDHATNQDILITSYDLLKRDIERYEKHSFFTQVIDEAQFIKNHSSQAAKAVKLIQANYKLALTGTPIENRLSELWSIFDYLMPGLLFSYQKFRKELEIPIVTNKNEQALSRIQKMINPFILRRTKQEVLKDLPDKLEENIFGIMEGEQQKLYDAHVSRIKIMLDKQSDREFKTSKIAILAELTKLRQLCCDPSLLYDGYKSNSIKGEMCVELIKSAVDGGHKTLVFSQFTTMLEKLEERLLEENINFYTLTGSTQKEDRIRLVDSFNVNDIPVFLISLRAGGTGLNLTGADIVIHYDPWWNVAVQNQATDRAHRIGQKQVVSVYRLLIKGTIEENIIRLQDKKRDLANQIFSGEGFGQGSFSKEELLELLS